MIDSVDSIVMLYSYAGFPERGFALFDRNPPLDTEAPQPDDATPTAHTSPQLVPTLPSSPGPISKDPSPIASVEEFIAAPLPANNTSPSSSSKTTKGVTCDGEANVVVEPVTDEEARRLRRMKRNAMSGLSILLTLMSILVAFTSVSVHYSHERRGTDVFLVSR